MHTGFCALLTALCIGVLSSAGAAENPIALLKAGGPQGCSTCGKNKSKETKEKLVLVVGCPRSGTAYIWKVLRTNGIDVGHEKEREQGVVSWLFTADSNKPAWGPRPVDYHFQHIFHQVRDPLKCIATMHLVIDRAWRYICREVPEIKLEDPILVRCAKMWYYWNMKAEQKAEMTYRVEAIKSALPEMSRRLGVELDPEVLKRISKTTHSTDHPYVVTWKDLHDALEPNFYKQLLQLAKHYGYDVSGGMALLKGRAG